MRDGRAENDLPNLIPGFSSRTFSRWSLAKNMYAERPRLGALGSGSVSIGASEKAGNLPFFFLPESALEALPLPRVAFSVLGMLRWVAVQAFWREGQRSSGVKLKEQEVTRTRAESGVTDSRCAGFAGRECYRKRRQLMWCMYGDQVATRSLCAREGPEIAKHHAAGSRECAGRVKDEGVYLQIWVRMQQKSPLTEVWDCISTAVGGMATTATTRKRERDSALKKQEMELQRALSRENA